MQKHIVKFRLIAIILGRCYADQKRLSRYLAQTNVFTRRRQKAWMDCLSSLQLKGGSFVLLFWIIYSDTVVDFLMSMISRFGIVNWCTRSEEIQSDPCSHSCSFWSGFIAKDSSHPNTLHEISLNFFENFKHFDFSKKKMKILDILEIKKQNEIDWPTDGLLHF